MNFRFPGVRIIDRYIMRKFLGTYLFAIALIIVIVIVFDVVEKIDDFIELDAPISDIFTKYYLNFIPFFVNQFSGLFTFIAVIFFTSKMAYQTEIVAILSGGVSFKRLMWPYFLAAAAITALSLTLNLVIIPVANENRIDFESKYLKSKKNVRYDKHIYRQIEPGVFAYIRDYSEQSHKASFMTIETYKDGSITEMLEAASVTFNPKTYRWTAPKYVTRSFEGENEILRQFMKLDTVINLNANELGRTEELIKTMNIRELNEFITQQESKGSDAINIYKVERNQRYSYPLATFILTLIGVALSSRKVRGGTGLHIGIGIALCFSYILISKFAEEFAKGGTLPTGLAVWTPNIIYACIGIYLYKKAPK
ncbi:MAG: LptF/LptG family permease [Rikenellaceae bacterium]